MKASNVNQYLSRLIPLGIGAVLSASMGLTIWIGFFFVFLPIGLSISIGLLIDKYQGNGKYGRKISITCVAFDFLIFLGVMQHENFQIEETVFYFAYFINTGIFSSILIHYAIAKIFGPFIWGRGFCGWACWTAALFEWLPIKENKTIPRKYTYIRIPVLILSLLIPFILIQSGYDFFNKHLYISGAGFPFRHDRIGQFIWFLAGNAAYYAIGVTLAVIFKKKRAFCKIFCPVSLIMKLQASVSLSRIKPSGNKCIGCGKCSRICPMDIDVMKFIKEGKRISSPECILCMNCIHNCPAKAIG